MNAFTSYTNTVKHIDLTKEEGLSLLIRDSFCKTENDWWLAGYATTISISGCECHPVLVKPSSEGHTLYVKTSLKGGGADALWEALEGHCPEFQNIIKAY